MSFLFSCLQRVPLVFAFVVDLICHIGFAAHVCPAFCVSFCYAFVCAFQDSEVQNRISCCGGYNCICIHTYHGVFGSVAGVSSVVKFQPANSYINVPVC